MPHLNRCSEIVDDGQKLQIKRGSEGTVYINTGEDVATFNRRITVTDYNKLADHVEVLTHLSIVQKNPTEPYWTRWGSPNPTSCC